MSVWSLEKPFVISANDDTEWTLDKILQHFVVCVDGGSTVMLIPRPIAMKWHGSLTRAREALGKKYKEKVMRKATAPRNVKEALAQAKSQVHVEGDGWHISNDHDRANDALSIHIGQSVLKCPDDLLKVIRIGAKALRAMKCVDCEEEMDEESFLSGFKLCRTCRKEG